MIYIIYPCPISFFPLDSFCPQIILPLYYFAPWKSLNDFHYIPMSHIISPLDSFCPCIILPLHIILTPGNRLMINTTYPCPISFSPLIHFAPISFCPRIILSFCHIPRTCHVFTRLFTSNTPWYFLDFALCPWREIVS